MPPSHLMITFEHFWLALSEDNARGMTPRIAQKLWHNNGANIINRLRNTGHLTNMATSRPISAVFNMSINRHSFGFHFPIQHTNTIILKHIFHAKTRLANFPIGFTAHTKRWQKQGKVRWEYTTRLSCLQTQNTVYCASGITKWRDSPTTYKTENEHPNYIHLHLGQWYQGIKLSEPHQ